MDLNSVDEHPEYHRYLTKGENRKKTDEIFDPNDYERQWKPVYKGFGPFSPHPYNPFDDYPIRRRIKSFVE